MMEEAFAASENERAKRRFSRHVGFSRRSDRTRLPAEPKTLRVRNSPPMPERRTSEFAGSQSCHFSTAHPQQNPSYREKLSRNRCPNLCRQNLARPRLVPATDARPPASALERRSRRSLGRLALAAATCRSLGNPIGRADQPAARRSQSARSAGIEVSDRHSALLFLADRRR